METRIATAMAKGTITEVLADLIPEISAQLEGATPHLMVVFASTKQPLAQLLPALSSRYTDTVVLGASTSGEFTQEGDSKDSTVVFALSGDFRVHAGLGRGLGADPYSAVSAAVRNIPNAVEGHPHRTALMLLDPLSGNGEQTTLIAKGLLGETVRLAGGAAGDDLKMKATQVGLGAQVASDAVVVAAIFSKEPIGVGVCHGHKPISKALRVTSAVGSTVAEIDDKPAWEVWKAETRERAKEHGLDPEHLKPKDVGSFLLRYEAGIKSGEEIKIRAPLSKNENGSLAFACGIPEGSEIFITESVPARQIESAREAARRARDQLGEVRCAGALVFDCICRNLILKQDFERATKGISEELGGVPIAGFETYGEIALDAGDMSGFHNTTTVVMAFPRGSRFAERPLLGSRRLIYMLEDLVDSVSSLVALIVAAAAAAAIVYFPYRLPPSCGHRTEWKHGMRIDDLPGCYGRLPRSASIGERTLRDAKHSLREVEEVIAATGAAEIKLDTAAVALKQGSHDPVVEAAHTVYEKAIAALRVRLAMSSTLPNLRADYRTSTEAAVLHTSDPSEAHRAAALSASEACLRAFRTAEARGIDLSIEAELMPGSVRPLYEGLRTCEEHRAAALGQAATAPREIAQQEGRPEKAASSENGAREEWTRLLKGDRRKIFEEHPDEYPSYVGQPGIRDALKAGEWTYGNTVFRFRKNKLIEQAEKRPTPLPRE